MPTAYTSLLGLALPVTGELSGTWGDTVNDAITSLLDSAVAGTTSLTSDADVTLTTTTGASNEARQAIIRWNPASGTTTRNITAPATSKVYVVINASGGTQSIVLRGAGPTTGVTIVKGETAICAWNGSDFIKIATRAGDGSFTTLTASGTVTFTGLTASQAVFTNASDELVSNAITGSGNVVMSASPTLTGTITASAITASSTITGNGNWVLGNADTDTITVGASFVNGAVLRSAKVATNTLALAAYDVDGTAYTNLVTLTASNTPTLALTSTGTGTINNMSVGATTASTGAFTTLSANSTVTFSGLTGSQAVFTNSSDELVSNAITGTGNVVMSTSPTISTPALDGETFSTAAAVTAGTNAQGQGALTSDYNVITTAAASPSGVTLPTATIGRRIIIVNKGANVVNVYPATGGFIDAIAVNTSIAVAIGAVMEFNASSTTQWYSSYNLNIRAADTAGTAVNVTGTVAIANGGTGVNTAPAALAALSGFTTTATAAGTTTLTNTSSSYQLFTGTTTQTVRLPVTSTLVTGWEFYLVNNSTGNVSIQSSGANAVITLLPGTGTVCTCIGTTLTTAADWEAGYTDFSTATGTGSVVLSATPTFTGTPASTTAAEKVATTQIATCAFVDRLRSLTTPSTAASGAVTAVVGDRGALLAQTSGSVTIPNAVFAARDVLTIYNNSASDITITQGASFTLRLVGTATTGNRTLAQRGLATVVFISASEAVISGGGLT
jgi:hypothetical protein